MRSALCLIVAIPAFGVTARAADLPSYNAAVIKYCESRVGKRVGSGECSHLANEALRVAGAEFTQVGADGKRIPDSPHPGDYVWGTLVKTYSFDEKTRQVVDSDPKAASLPGDILQFDKVKTSDGYQFPHHTAIVRTVDAAGNPSGVFQQNIKVPGGKDGREVQKSPLPTLRMVSGMIMVYRPAKATNPAPMQFTWVNNSKSQKVEFTYFGKKDSLGTPNTADAYRVVWASGPRANTVTVDGVNYTLAARKAYEFYTTSDGKIALRELEP